MPDRPIKELGYKTPLEMAHTPYLDKIAIDGISGMMHTVDIGVRPGSDTAHLSLFGYDPYVYYTGRGPYECAGIGMDIKKGDIGLRVNASTVDDAGSVLDRRASRIEDTRPLAEYLGTIEIDDWGFILKASLGHRMGMIMRGKNLSPKVTDQDPHRTGVKILQVKPLDDTAEAKRTAHLLNEFTRLTLERLKNFPLNQKRVRANKLPANALLFRGAGMIPEHILTFREKYNLRAVFIAGAPMYQGLAKIFGMDVVTFAPEDKVTGLANSNLNIKIDKAIKSLDTHDAVFVHIKGADILAEDGNYKEKISFIEKIDAAVKPLSEKNDFLVVITSDHTTSSQLKIHTADPVPITIKGEGVRTDDITAFTERECSKGRLGIIRGQNLMPILIDLMGLAELYGA